MSDPTEGIRRQMVAEINAKEAGREELEKEYGQVWNTRELQQDFEVTAFLAPFVGVTRKSDGKKGLLKFQHDPRFYFSFTEA